MALRSKTIRWQLQALANCLSWRPSTTPKIWTMRTTGMKVKILNLMGKSKATIRTVDLKIRWSHQKVVVWSSSTKSRVPTSRAEDMKIRLVINWLHSLPPSEAVSRMRTPMTSVITWYWPRKLRKRPARSCRRSLAAAMSSRSVDIEAKVSASSLSAAMTDRFQAWVRSTQPTSFKSRQVCVRLGSTLTYQIRKPYQVSSSQSKATVAFLPKLVTFSTWNPSRTVKPNKERSLSRLLPDHLACSETSPSPPKRLASIDKPLAVRSSQAQPTTTTHLMVLHIISWVTQRRWQTHLFSLTQHKSLKAIRVIDGPAVSYTTRGCLNLTICLLWVTMRRVKSWTMLAALSRASAIV